MIEKILSHECDLQTVGMRLSPTPKCTFVNAVPFNGTGKLSLRFQTQHTFVILYSCSRLYQHQAAFAETATSQTLHS